MEGSNKGPFKFFTITALLIIIIIAVWSQADECDNKHAFLTEEQMLEIVFKKCRLSFGSGVLGIATPIVINCQGTQNYPIRDAATVIEMCKDLSTIPHDNCFELCYLNSTTYILVHPLGPQFGFFPNLLSVDPKLLNEDADLKYRERVAGIWDFCYRELATGSLKALNFARNGPGWILFYCTFWATWSCCVHNQISILQDEYYHEHVTQTENEIRAALAGR